MPKIAMTVLRKDAASVLSPHFGMAKWILVLDPQSGETELVRNTGLTGRAVVEAMVDHGCTDAVFASIGDGALRHLEAAGIRGWFAPADRPAPELVDALRQGELDGAQQASHAAPRRHRGR